MTRRMYRPWFRVAEFACWTGPAQAAALTDTPGYSQGAQEWIRIERSGNTFTLSRSNDGSSWFVMDSRTISMGTMIYIGMAVTANSTTTLATGVFDNVATTGSGATPTPTATNTPLPTNTPTATNTPVSTNTPTPTNTPTHSPTPAPDVWIKRSSYGIAGQMVAFRVTGDPVSANNGLFYVLSDHLGSTSLLVNSSGGTVTGSTTRYLPFGGYQGTAPSQSITDRDFTGQKENMGLGLLYYGARFYVPGVGRFLSADSIVPSPGNPQSFNRYSYVQNSPINRIDPSGHVDCALLGDAADSNGCNNQVPSIAQQVQQQDNIYGIEFSVDDDKSWADGQMESILAAARDIEHRFRKEGDFAGYAPGQIWQEIYGTVTMLRSSRTHYTDDDGVLQEITHGGWTNGSTIEVYDTASSDPFKFRLNMVHEFGHRFNAVTENATDMSPYDDLGAAINSGALPARSFVRTGMAEPPYQQSPNFDTNGELSADMFVNWTYQSFANNPQGVQNKNWMNSQMPIWLGR